MERGGDGKKLAKKDGAAEEYEYDDQGNLVICHLSSTRRVTLAEHNGTILVSVREYYTKGDKEFPSAKGISLTMGQWKVLKNNAAAIDDAIQIFNSS
ncbi:hypothetical protein ABFS82_01G111900 [Erythranthe guttata]